MNVSDAAISRGKLERRLAELEREVRLLRAARRAESTSINQGSLVVQGGSIQLLRDDGTLVAYFGPVVLPGGTPSAGVILNRHGGEQYFVLAGDPGAQFWALEDEAGNIVMSDDAASGQGLATPYIPLNSFPTRVLLTMGGQVTTNLAFEPLWTIQGHKQHPRLRAGVWVATTDTTTTAEIRLRNADTGAILAGPTAVAATNNTFLLFELTGAIAGAHLGGVKAEVDARRTAGAGNVNVQLAYAEGIQSP